ncbi:SDR family oxidoreductase [Reyranella sp.]|jgi:nucleoside-diphosphate-sugar epimerase|uniref:SDR family oxidoreductase n=1 Tax=Reyranella sp. TaxID=1929291 RepID=UPI00263780F8|nr:SDR family oxidoreductase [Reyranella sp.]HQS19217.1 SDR family oxidoreductase [Reyranella sp.]HQT15488.1 SDR family oxidoreductase [Reyranella sp.]
MTRRLFIFGLGFSGLEIAKLARADGWTVAGTCTTEEKARRLREAGIEAHRFDGTAALSSDAFGEPSHVVCTIAPGSEGDPALRTCRALLGRAGWLGYLSTTGVYGDHEGGWVDETTAPLPTQPRSQQRLAAEQGWREVASGTGASLHILRLPGIYGSGRSTLDRVRAGTAQRIDKPGQVFSRIHVEDLAASAMKAAARTTGTEIWNVADDLPASNADVIAYACELLGRPVPPVVPWEAAAPAMSAMARSFYSESRRVKNDKLKRELGVRLRYPTYREGLKAIAAAEG